MATIPTQFIYQNGILPVYMPATANGDNFENNEKSFLHVKNATTVDRHVYVDSRQDCGQDHHHDLDIIVEANSEEFIGPQDLRIFGGLPWLSYDNPANVTLAVFSPTSQYVGAYGLQWDQSTDVYTRLGDCARWNAGSDFDATPPWGSARRSMVNDQGNVVAFYGDPLYDEFNTCCQKMVTFDRCYYKATKVGSVYEWWLSPVKYDSTFKLFPTFSRDGVEKLRIYLGVYKGYYNTAEGKLESLAFKKPSSNYTIAQFRTAARARNGGVANKWELRDYLITSLVQMMYLIKYGGFNSQLLLSNGVTNITDDGSTNMAINTGSTSQLGNKDGKVFVTHYQTGEVTESMSLFGVEDFYGDIWEFIDGINIQVDYKPWIADHDFVSDTFAHPYVDTSLTLHNADGYVGDIAVNANHDYGFLASALGGSATTKLCDYYYRATGNRIALAGGGWYAGSDAGAFLWFLNNASSGSNRNVGARLMLIP